MKHRATSVLAAFMLVWAVNAAWADWTHYAGNPQRNSTSSLPAGIDLSAPVGIAAPVSGALVGATSPMVYNGRLYAHGVRSSDGQSALFCFDIASGAELWTAPVGIDPWGSWASPAVDPTTNSVMLGAANTMVCVDATTGTSKWVSNPTFTNDVANCSPLVLGNRIFVADSGWSNTGQSYVYSVRMSDGTIDWSQPIGTMTGTTLAADPSGANVYVADSDGANGWIRGFSALDGTPGINQQIDTGNGGFWGGVSMNAGALYAVNYPFSGDFDATLYKINPADGSVIWSEPAVRGDTMPVVANGMVFLSGGNTSTYVQAFDDATGDLLWTFDQAGDWTQQALYADGLLYVGQGVAGSWDPDPALALYVLDTSLTPADPGFVVDTYVGAGSSPALGSDLYTIGAAGIYHFALVPEPATVALVAAGVVCLLLRRRRRRS